MIAARLATLGVGLIAPVALGQCGPVWLPGLQDVGTSGFQREGDGLISSAAFWAPDPSHPERTALAFSGPALAGGVAVHGGAVFEAGRWRPLAASSNPPSVTGLCPTSQGLFACSGAAAVRLVNGDWVRAGTTFTRATARFIAETASGIYIVVQDNSLLTTSVRRWTGADWTVVGGLDGTVNSLLARADGLYLAGGFTHAEGVSVDHIAKFDGQHWSAGPGLADARMLCEDGGRLYAAGPGLSIVRWDDDHWTTVGTAPDGFWQSMAVVHGEVLIGGYFLGLPAPLDQQFVLRLEGGAWRQVGGGISGRNTQGLPNVKLLATPAGLVAFGAFHSAEGMTVRNAALWDGVRWSHLGGIDDPVLALVPYGDRVAVGGAFTGVGAEAASYIAVYDGYHWSPMGLGVDGPVRALAAFEGDLIAGGDFTHAGDQPAGGVARWDGHRWRPLGSADGSVGALAVWSGRLVAGVNHRTGGTACSIAVWDGAAWSRLGPVFVGGWISALESYHDRLYAGGSFPTAITPDARKLACWDGARWAGVNGEFSGDVFTLKTIGDDLYVGGQFGFEVGGAFVSNFIARWSDAAGWSGLAAGVGPVRAILPIPGGLLLAGQSTFLQPPGAYRWTGGAVAELVSVAGARVNALAAFRGGVLMGGDFMSVDGRVSRHLAHLEPAQAPAIASGPGNAACVFGGRAELSAAPDFGLAERLNGVAFQWRRDGAPIADGPGGASPGGGVVAGASGIYADSRGPITLAIDGAAFSDAGAYTLVLTNPCGETIGGPAELTVRPTPCPTDFNNDGATDEADYDAFLLAHLRGQASSDFNGDGFLDFFDYDDFVAALEQGC